MTASGDAVRLTTELQAMRIVYEQLRPLNQGERDRVLGWVSARLDADRRASPAPVVDLNPDDACVRCTHRQARHQPYGCKAAGCRCDRFESNPFADPAPDVTAPPENATGEDGSAL